MSLLSPIFVFFFFNATATTEIYTLSLHDALPICTAIMLADGGDDRWSYDRAENILTGLQRRSEEHTSELQSRENLVCRLLLEKKKNNQPTPTQIPNTSASTLA